LSSQLVVSATGGSLHTPVPESHVPTSWHWYREVDATGIGPVQAAGCHVYVSVHASLSSQLVVSATGGSLHTPVPESHVPTSWHWSDAVHTTGFAPVLTPA